MLNTEQKIHRLEDVLARVRRNRGNLRPFEESTATEDQAATAGAEPDLPAPSEPPPVQRISWGPDSHAPAAAVEAPLEPEPLIVSQYPVVHSPEPEPEPEPVLEPLPEPISATPEPASEPVTIIPAAPEPVVLSPESEPEPVVLSPEPEPEPIAVTPSETRTFESAVAAAGPVFSISGTHPREWTLHAVLDRAWRVGHSDKNES